VVSCERFIHTFVLPCSVLCSQNNGQLALHIHRHAFSPPPTTDSPTSPTPLACVSEMVPWCLGIRHCKKPRFLSGHCYRRFAPRIRTTVFHWGALGRGRPQNASDPQWRQSSSSSELYTPMIWSTVMFVLGTSCSLSGGTASSTSTLRAVSDRVRIPTVAHLKRRSSHFTTLHTIRQFLSRHHAVRCSQDSTGLCGRRFQCSTTCAMAKYWNTLRYFPASSNSVRSCTNCTFPTTLSYVRQSCSLHPSPARHNYISTPHCLALLI
jgi:hypothetical protein